jgi:hypothetical protein
MIAGYNESVAKLEADMKSFVEEAKAGADGHGSKASASRARKLSNSITKDLKVFRQLSIGNDKTKTK